MTVTEGMMEGAQGHDVSIPIFADSALATRPQTSSIMSHARAANEALYSHKCVKIVSFAASEINRTSTTDKHARGAREAWQSPFERTIAFGESWSSRNSLKSAPNLLSRKLFHLSPNRFRGIYELWNCHPAYPAEKPMLAS
ncbi:hypothetical protein AAL_05798 [Moelleriella libera RCEF 2490]|uniref:Uncharacterized protein n=1 Tax=Moelleriella libera RCEF 2490 TaxID=1081109 RepID=A0A162IH79_9HYPO|nr:hypothetical protein AAL_05798 [Moelleriella libera RCEF 2490]